MTPDRALERAVRRTRQFLLQHPVATTRGWLVAVSGGADSLALWRITAALGRDLGFAVEALHVDHGLRPSCHDEAQRVRSWAPLLGTPCHVVSVRVPSTGQGPEAEARQVRYQALEAVRAQRGLDGVALGHTLDDQAETVLMRSLTGSGLRGLAAMHPFAEGRWRPLLWMRRSEARQVAQNLGVDIVDDASNRDRRLRRPWLRHEVLPLIEGVLGDVAPQLAALAEQAEGASDLITRALASHAAVPAGPGVVVASRSQVGTLAPWLRAEWLMLNLQHLGVRPRRARVSAQRFARLIDGTAPFALHLAGARVRGSALELRIEVTGP
ncbi:MAG: tRNA lysidine(34) synthetase TilS [Pseudomonadota bacterium]